MKNILVLLFMITLTKPQTINQPITKMDPVKYVGKWYVIGWIPTVYDRKWSNCTETYRLNKKGDYNIYTTYTVGQKNKSMRSKGFLNPEKGNAAWKVQFVWPFRADYWIIEMGEDYSYTVVGHPKHKFLFIMARKPVMSDSLYGAVTERCKEKGYETDKLRKQVQDLTP
jgi:apolipoprotein D and lipocalin family protein